ncbi:major histocompatibility complex class I-related gene protein isoform X1 [Xenopus laevis]|uniref:Major histocompatibility complex class I-related gene protein isoform X1 n=2 Tax=Xenopus laevis TaxID=8355 RepID=A0A8J1LMJ5_XENLA|nr:major histocompatibility complex class I-related gene protein isoform X1 [Xenopus laevis]
MRFSSSNNIVEMVNAFLLLFSFAVPAVYCGSHSLQYHIALVSNRIYGVPQFSVIMYVDGIQYGRYNSDVQYAQAFTPSLNVLSEHIEKQTKYAQEYEVWQRHMLKFLMGFFNKTNSKGNEDIHIYQRKSACELHDDGTIGGYQEIAFDGKEFFIFDKKRVMYLPVSQDAVMVSRLWNIRYDATDSKEYIENECIEHLKLYLPIISNDLEKKVIPKLKVSSSESESGVKLHCRVYGFYPRDVEVKWIKNERHEIDSEEAPEILPNPDGTYQIRVSVEVTPEEGATYSCHVDHSSLENPLVFPFEFDKRSIFFIIIPVCATLFSLLVIVVVCVFVYKKRKKDHKNKHKRVSTENKDLKSKYTQNLQ